MSKTERFLESNAEIPNDKKLDICNLINVEVLSEAILIRNLFRWDANGAIKYDKENNEILINEEMLMHAIRIVNPAQQTRKLKLISQEEWFRKNE